MRAPPKIDQGYSSYIFQGMPPAAPLRRRCSRFPISILRYRLLRSAKLIVQVIAIEALGMPVAAGSGVPKLKRLPGLHGGVERVS